MNLKKRLLEIKEELRSLQASLATAKDEELDGISEKVSALETEMRSVKKKIALQAQAQRSALSITEDDGEEGEDDNGEEGEEDHEQRSIVISQSDNQNRSERRRAERLEKRKKMGEDLINNRTVILDSTVLYPKKQSDVLTPFPFNQVSNIVNAVRYTPVINGETYDSPYITGNGTGDYTAQPVASGSGGKYANTAPTWDKVTITKTKITAYGEITKELERTPVAGYADAVEANITIALRKKLAREMVIGDGATGHFVGIFSATLNGKNTVADYKIGEINENTLDEIVLNYGGDEDIESRMSLLLNKLTLLSFAKVRGTDKKKVYTINYEAGTIDGIKFFTSSHVKAFAKATAGTEKTASAAEVRGDAFLAYGDFNQYEVAVFSNIETAKSTDFKFDQGITCFRGDVFMGGNVVGYKAFMRVYKGASTVKELTEITVGE